MGVTHIGLMHRDPYQCKVKGFCAVSSIERNVSKGGTCKGCNMLLIIVGNTLYIKVAHLVLDSEKSRSECLKFLGRLELKNQSTHNFSSIQVEVLEHI